MSILTFLPELVTGGLGTGMIGVLGYFLKKQNDKIEAVDIKLGNLSQNLQDKMNQNTREVVRLFNDICHERQGACSKLVDTKLEILHQETKTICHKIDQIKQDREKNWTKQDRINDKINSHLSRSE